MPTYPTYRADPDALAVAEQVVSAIRLANRRRDAMLANAKRVANPRMYAIATATEGLGLHGEENPLSPKDLKLLEEFTAIVEDLLRYTKAEYLGTILRQLQIMYGDVLIRSKNLLSIDQIIPSESWRSGGAPSPSRERMADFDPMD